MKSLSWSIEYVRLAVAAAHPLLGTIQILYNNRPVTNLHFAVIRLRNESNADLQDVVVNLGSLEGSRFLVSYGLLTGGLQYFPVTQEFDRVLRDSDPAHAAQRMEYILRRRDYRIPVLNRGATADLVVLTERDDVAEPKVNVACEHPGVKLVQQTTAPLMIWGERFTKTVAIMGVIIGLATTVILARLIPSPWIVGLAAWLIGASGTAMAIIVVKFWRFLLRVLS
jgi:hypothetical protein